MNNKTKFEKTTPLINRYSVCKSKIDEDLKSELIEYSIVLIKSDGFADKLANYKKS